MTETNVSDINVDEIMEKIRQEIQMRKGIDKDSTASASLHSQSKEHMSEIEHLAIDFPRVNTPFEFKEDGYHVNDFLKFHGQEFVVNAYKGILRRQPDPEGLNNFLTNLRQGHITKVEVLGRLRYSPEGRSRATSVTGLFFPFLAHSSFKIPILGYLSRLITGILQLPTIIKNIQNLDSHTHIYFQESERRLAGVSNSVQCKVNEIIDRQTISLDELAQLIEKQLFLEELASQKVDRSAFEQLVSQKVDRSAFEQLASQKVDRSAFEQLASQKVDRSAFEELVSQKVDRSALEELASQKVDRSAFEELDAAKADQTALQELFKRINNLRRSLTENERRLGLFLEEAIKRLPEPFDQEQLKKITDEAQHMFDALYVAFEDKFRGSREDIKGRVEIYLPYVVEACKVTDNAPIIDVGCGRGEWLELLVENGLAAQGVDINRVMISESLDRGFDVVEEDAISFLKRQPADSLSAITGFHIVEHLPFEKMIALFDESLRVLKSGGMVIFETPNPENLIVGACDFYTDPTHKQPIPPSTLKFMLEARGFIRSKIHRLHPKKEVSYLKDEAMQDVNDLLYSVCREQDYSIIGYKP